MGDVIRLEPANPDPHPSEMTYLPHIPWKLVAIVAAGVLLVITFLELRQMRKIETLRAQIAVTQRELGPMLHKVNLFRDQLVTWTQTAASGRQPFLVDPRLNISALHRGRGLYLRVPANHASPKQIAHAAHAMIPDSIGACLGLDPLSTKPLFKSSRLLDPTLAETIENARGLMRLRVLQEELRRNVDKDLPQLSQLLQSEWFLLVVERGPHRHQGDVDVFLWDLRSHERLLAVRTQANGQLISARTGPRGVRPSKHIGQVGAQDCSIASQIQDVAQAASAKPLQTL